MLPRNSRRRIPGGYSLVPPLPPEALGRRPPRPFVTPDLPVLVQMGDARLRDILRAALKGSAATPEVKRLRGSVGDGAASPDPTSRSSRYSPVPPRLHRVGAPGDTLDELFGGDDDENESAGDGADWDDDLEADPYGPDAPERGARSLPSRKTAGIWRIVNTVAEPKWAYQHVSGILTSTWANSLADLNIGDGETVNLMIGRMIRVQRLQLNCFVYRTQDGATAGDSARLVLVRDRQGSTVPASSALFAGAVASNLHDMVLPSARGRFDVLFDETYDLPRYSRGTGENLCSVRLDIPVDDPVRFGDVSLSDTVRYYLWVVCHRVDGGTGIAGTLWVTYVDP